MIHTLEKPDSGNVLIVDGEVKNAADYELDGPTVTNTSLAQGTANLEAMRKHERLAQEDAHLEAIRDKNPGVYVTLEQHYQDTLDLVDAISLMSIYKGLKAGGSLDPEFQKRYGEQTPHVIAGAEVNHRKLVDEVIPDIYHQSEFDQDVFDPIDVADDITLFRMEAVKKFGGLDKEKAKKHRADERSRLIGLGAVQRDFFPKA